MRFTMTKEVTDCNDCPCTRYDNDMGATIPYCSHKKAPPGYDSVIQGGRGSLELPDWCPLKAQEKTNFWTRLKKKVGTWKLVDEYVGSAIYHDSGREVKAATSFRVYKHSESGKLKLHYKKIGCDSYTLMDPDFQHLFIREESKWTQSQ